MVWEQVNRQNLNGCKDFKESTNESLNYLEQSESAFEEVADEVLKESKENLVGNLKNRDPCYT